jgi:putative ABC transport system permease protein
MIFTDTFQFAMRNLREAMLRTMLTTLGVSIGIASLVGMVSLGVGLQEQFVGRFVKSGVFDAITVMPNIQGFGRNARPIARKAPKARADEPAGMAKAERPEKPREKLDDAAIQKIAAIPQVREVFPNLRIPVEIRYEQFSEFSGAAGVPPSARGEGVFQKVSHGSFFSNDSDDICMLSLDFAHRIYEGTAGDLIGKEVTLAYAASASTGQGVSLGPMGGISIQRTEKKYRIVGIIEREPGPNLGMGMFSSVMIPLRKAQEIGVYDITNPQALLSQLSEKRTYSSITVKVKRAQDTEEAEKKIKDMGFAAFSINDALQGAKKAFILLDLFLSLVGSIALSVASLGIVNTMVMSILERTREIGIMKAIGGSDGDIRGIFLVEASTIGVLGGLLGMLLGWGVGRMINFGANIYIERQGGVPDNLFSIPLWLAAGALAFSVIVSLLAGSYPASRAARLDDVGGAGEAIEARVGGGGRCDTGSCCCWRPRWSSVCPWRVWPRAAAGVER